MRIQDILDLYVEGKRPVTVSVEHPIKPNISRNGLIVGVKNFGVFVLFHRDNVREFFWDKNMDWGRTLLMKDLSFSTIETIDRR